MNKKISTHNIQYIIEQYSQGINSEIIAKNLNLNSSTICRYLKKNSIEIRSNSENKRKIYVNDSWLEDLSNFTEPHTYFLGLFLADGNISKSKNDCKIILHKKDKDILIKYSHIFYGFDNTKLIKNNYVGLYIYSKKFKESLINLQIFPKKSYTAIYPSWIPEHLHKHFIRGLIDGDGGISFSSCPRIYLTGTTEIINSVIYLLNKYCNVKNPLLNKRFPNKNNNNLSVEYKRYEEINLILSWLYDDSFFYLKRKYQKYLEFKDKYKKYQENHYSAEEKQRMILLYENLKTYNSVAKLLKINPSVVRKIIKKYYDKN